MNDSLHYFLALSILILIVLEAMLPRSPGEKLADEVRNLSMKKSRLLLRLPASILSLSLFVSILMEGVI